MDLSEHTDFQRLNSIIMNIRNEIRTIMENHYKNITHTPQRKQEELSIFFNLLQFATRKWVFDIIFELELNGPRGFNEIMRNLEDISSRLLSDRLKELTGHQLVSRTVLDTTPPTVEYALTDKGKGLTELSMLLIWHLANN